MLAKSNKSPLPLPFTFIVRTAVGWAKNGPKTNVVSPLRCVSDVAPKTNEVAADVRAAKTLVPVLSKYWYV